MKPSFHTLKINEIRQETPDAVSISFEIPDDIKHVFHYQSGQYLTLKTSIDGEEIRRSYSLCSSPFENSWRVAVKKIEQGKFSTYANEHLTEGTTLEVMSPMGNFVLPESLDEKHFVFFAAGSGVTPVFSMLKTILNQSESAVVTLVYGNKGFQTIIFREELEALKNTYMNRFRVIHVLSKESLGNELQKGRIDEEKTNRLIQTLLPIDGIDGVYICGPESMIHGVKAAFINAGLSVDTIHFELFGTATPVVSKVQETDEVITSLVTVILDGEVLDIPLASNQINILDAALEAGADLPFACKGGVCCTCKAKIMEGTARMDVNYALEPDEVAAGYILTCQSHPTSERLVVSFDE
jgi:ring-1,2-phenylacetyl-CoA epoxidase subunit PaaE